MLLGKLIKYKMLNLEDHHRLLGKILNVKNSWCLDMTELRSQWIYITREEASIQTAETESWWKAMERMVWISVKVSISSKLQLWKEAGSLLMHLLEVVERRASHGTSKVNLWTDQTRCLISSLVPNIWLQTRSLTQTYWRRRVNQQVAHSWDKAVWTWGLTCSEPAFWTCHSWTSSTLFWTRPCHSAPPITLNSETQTQTPIFTS